MSMTCTLPSSGTQAGYNGTKSGTNSPQIIEHVDHSTITFNICPLALIWVCRVIFICYECQLIRISLIYFMIVQTFMNWYLLITCSIHGHLSVPYTKGGDTYW